MKLTAVLHVQQHGSTVDVKGTLGTSEPLQCTSWTPVIGTIEPERAQCCHVYGKKVLSWMDDNDDQRRQPTMMTTTMTATTDDDDVSSACDVFNRDQQYGQGSTWTGSPLANGWGLYSMCTMRALQVDRLQRRRDLADPVCYKYHYLVLNILTYGKPSG